MKNQIFYFIAFILLIFINCSDDCEDTLCLNGGQCDPQTLQCVCVNGFTGNNCEIDPINLCDNINCGNNGNCVNGNCECFNGYSGANCEIAPQDPCLSINCGSNGNCNNGICICINGYTGQFCENPPQQTLISMRINSIKITRFPSTDNGSPWDTGLEGNPNPDIYPYIHQNNNEVFDSPSYSLNANSTLDYLFTQGLPVTLTNVLNQYTIQVWDDDNGTDDWIGGITFTPANNNTNNTTLILDASGSVAFELNVTWNF